MPSKQWPVRLSHQRPQTSSPSPRESCNRTSVVMPSSCKLSWSGEARHLQQHAKKSIDLAMGELDVGTIRPLTQASPRCIHPFLEIVSMPGSTLGYLDPQATQ